MHEHGMLGLFGFGGLWLYRDFRFSLLFRKLLHLVYVNPHPRELFQFHTATRRQTNIATQS